MTPGTIKGAEKLKGLQQEAQVCNYNFPYVDTFSVALRLLKNSLEIKWVKRRSLKLTQTQAANICE